MRREIDTRLRGTYVARGLDSGDIEARSTGESDDSLALTPIVVSLCDLVERRGVDRARLLEGSGLTADALADPFRRIEESLVKRLLRRAIDLLGDPSAALELGLLLTIQGYGFWGYAAMASATLGEATFGVLERYHRAFSPSDLEVRIEDDHVVIHVQMRSAWGDLFPFLADAGAVSFARVLEHLVGGPIAGLEVWLPYGEQPHHRVMRSMLAATLRFECSGMQFRFEKGELARQVVSADPALAAWPRRSANRN